MTWLGEYTMEMKSTLHMALWLLLALTGCASRTGVVAVG